MKKLMALVLFVIFLAACTSSPTGEGNSTPIVMTAEVSTVIASNGGTPGSFATAEPPTSIPALPGGPSVTDLKYKVLDKFPDFFYCDPDLYPIARVDETTLAQQAFPELQANQEEFQAILSHLGLSDQTTFTGEQKLQIYQEHKKLNAIVFQLVDGRYQFQIQTGLEGQQGSLVTGAVDSSGSIDIITREQASPNCPICLAKGTLIDTPRGPIPVEDLQVGDSVWTQDVAGRRVSASLVRTGHVRVPVTHHMIHVILSDGRELWASPGHPTADGRRLGELKTASMLDGAQIVRWERIPYGDNFTYDILPSGTTGDYWADGILMGSTLSAP